MITYRNPLWNIMVKFLKELKKLPYLVDNFDGKFSKRIETIYNAALSSCHISSTNWKLIIDTLQYVTEKDVTDEMREAFEEAAVLGTKCHTSSDGEIMFRDALASAQYKKRMAEAKRQLEEARKKKEEADSEHEKYMSEHQRTIYKIEEAGRELEEARKKFEKVMQDEQAGVVPVGQGDKNDKK